MAHPELPHRMAGRGSVGPTPRAAGGKPAKPVGSVRRNPPAGAAAHPQASLQRKRPAATDPRALLNASLQDTAQQALANPESQSAAEEYEEWAAQQDDGPASTASIAPAADAAEPPVEPTPRVEPQLSAAGAELAARIEGMKVRMDLSDGSYFWMVSDRETKKRVRAALAAAAPVPEAGSADEDSQSEADAPRLHQDAVFTVAEIETLIALIKGETPEKAGEIIRDIIEFNTRLDATVISAGAPDIDAVIEDPPETPTGLKDRECIKCTNFSPSNVNPTGGLGSCKEHMIFPKWEQIPNPHRNAPCPKYVAAPAIKRSGPRP